VVVDLNNNIPMTNNEASNLHVLLADDDMDDSFIFNAAVEQSNYPIRLTITEDGQKLLAYLENEGEPDIIFLDINMPFHNGIECLATIRANKRFDKVPVVMYSTTNNKLNIEACYNSGANLYVVKPSSFEEVDKMVKKICSKEWVTNIQVPSKEQFIMYSFS
jgi:CheY-like chemotaxis protein